MNEQYLVTKSNTLINSSYDLSLEEQRIILTLASMVQPSDKDFKPYIFNIKNFISLLGVEDKKKYSEIPKITKELMKKIIEIHDEEKIVQTAWLSSAVYKKGTGMVELEFSPRLKPFMLGLKEFYTSYRLANILELKGKYSIRLYEILKSNEFKKICIIEIEELRKILKIEEQYKLYADFKRKIIEFSQNELKKKTDIYFKFEEIKTGRKVTSLKFFIFLNANNVKNKNNSIPQIDENEDYKKVELIFNNEEIKGLNAKKVYDKAVETIKDEKLNVDVFEYLKERKNMVDDYAKNTNLEKGYLPTLLNCITSWQPTKKVYAQQQGMFNNYEQRKYDFEDLEKKLLGWDKVKEIVE